MICILSGAEDLLIDGRDVTLSVSRAGRLPRRYRGRDAIDWQNRMGFLDKKVEDLENMRMKFGGEPHMTGRNGGYTISLQGLEVKGAAMASDAFFPFRDGSDKAASSGIATIIQPGGSIRDEEVIAAADENDIAMVFTATRHFRHLICTFWLLDQVAENML